MERARAAALPDRHRNPGPSAVGGGRPVPRRGADDAQACRLAPQGAGRRAAPDRPRPPRQHGAEPRGGKPARPQHRRGAASIRQRAVEQIEDLLLANPSATCACCPMCCIRRSSTGTDWARRWNPMFGVSRIGQASRSAEDIARDCEASPRHRARSLPGRAGSADQCRSASAARGVVRCASSGSPDDLPLGRRFWKGDAAEEWKIGGDCSRARRRAGQHARANSPDRRSVRHQLGSRHDDRQRRRAYGGARRPVACPLVRAALPACDLP